MFGFTFRETMRGRFFLLSDPLTERKITFSLIAQAAQLRRFALDKTCYIAGHVTADGLATNQSLVGTLKLLLVQEGRLPYRFSFAGDDGRSYAFVGQKEFSLLAPIQTMTELPAAIYDENQAEIARATVHFDIQNDLGQFLRSFRPGVFL
jgi:hypothetical protein